jgi:thiol-disulfide isomerase/thioredoxin
VSQSAKSANALRTGKSGASRSSGAVGGSNRARRQAARQAAARRKRWAWGGAGFAALLVLAAVLGAHFASSSSGPVKSSNPPPAEGAVAPGGTFTTLAGKTVSLSSFRGHPTLLWFMTTWCSSCEAGTEAMAKDILPKLAADGVKVVQVENYQDLGQSGPSLGNFAKTLAGPEFHNPDWIFGMASSSLTRRYNPQAYLDIYYLINAKGRIVYVNSSPASTMSQLLSAAKGLA